jgi:long-chain acyl-CoA synthetase
VVEAMLIGNNRPFCTALLWIPDNSQETSNLPEIVENAIIKINQQFSHPEQIKRWAIIPGGLSINNGDLTASLKLKKYAIELRLKDLIEVLYEKEPVSHFENVTIGKLPAQYNPNP